MKVHQYAIMCASIIAQEAAIEALTHGDRAAESMREEYKRRRNFIVSALNQIGLKCQLPRGSFYAFPDIRATGLSSKDFAVRLLQEEKVAAVPGAAFGPSGEGFLRMCFATAFDQIQIAMERTAKFVERVRRG